MPISGVVVLTGPDKTEEVLDKLQKMDGVTTYGIHNDCHIVSVLEAETLNDLENMSETIGKSIQGVLGVYPAYVNFEDEVQSEI